MNIKNLFVSIGLPEEEADIMAILYKEGSLRVSEIGTHTSIPRTSIYMHLKALEKRGYALRSKKGKILTYTPVNPEGILESLDERASAFGQAVPTLVRLARIQGDKPTISFLDSRLGIQQMYRDMLGTSKKKEIVYTIESAETTKENLERLPRRFINEWQRKMIEKDVITMGIVTGDARVVFSSMSDELKVMLRQRSATVRLLETDAFPFSINLYLVGNNRCYIFVPQKEFALKIESKEIYTSLVTLFKLMFEKSKAVQFKELLD